MAVPRGFFDVDERLAALSRAGDPLERLASVVDFELFRDELERALLRSDRAKGGRPPYDAVLMFRLLVLQTLDTLSDEQAEYQVRDRLSPPPSADGGPFGIGSLRCCARSCASSGSASATLCRTPRRSGCSASS